MTEQKLRIRRIVLLVAASAKITSNVEHVAVASLQHQQQLLPRDLKKKIAKKRSRGKRDRQVYQEGRGGKFIKGKESVASLFIDQQLAKSELRNLSVSRESA